MQNPIYIDDINEPQPDLTVLKPGNYTDMAQHPTADDISPVIEVADTTLQPDRHVKIPRYAQAGIPEAWIVNLSGRIVEVYSEPVQDKYANIHRMGHGRSITPRLLPGVTIAVDDFLGKPR